jgi:hypothetical protein
MHDRDYVKWVQRALNLALPTMTPCDGSAESPDYRTRVRGFNDAFLYHLLRPGFDKVDRATQDALIRSNHADPGFRHWACVAMGDPQPLSGARFRAAVKQFQKRPFKGLAELDDDGWVGRRTEERMFLFARFPHPGDMGSYVPPGVPPPPGPPPDSDEADDDLVARAINRLGPIMRIRALAGRAQRMFRGYPDMEKHTKVCAILADMPTYHQAPQPMWYFIKDDIQHIAASHHMIWRNYQEALKEYGGPAGIIKRMQHTDFMTDGSHHLKIAATGNWQTAAQLEQADRLFRTKIRHMVSTLEQGLWQMDHEINLVGHVRKADQTFYTRVPERIEQLSRDRHHIYHAYFMPGKDWWEKISRMSWPKQ